MNTRTDIHPPQWPLKLLRFFVKKEFLEEIEGDMEEVFHETVEQFSAGKAKRVYAWEVLKLFRPVLLRNFHSVHTLNHYPMFKSYFKISVRSLLKNPTSSFINIFGLAVAIGICLVVYSFLEFDYSIDRFHKHKDNVFLVSYIGQAEGTSQQYGMTPRPLGDMMRDDFAQVKKVCRVEDGNVVLKVGDNVFHEQIRYVDSEFLEMFTFPLKWGNAASLRDLNSIVLSEAMADKYFGAGNPVGEDVLVKFDEQRSKVFKVTGVAAVFPKAHAIEFNFLVNFENIRTADPGYDKNDWGKFVKATIIQVDNPEDVTLLQQRMAKYTTFQNQAQRDWPITSFVFEPLASLHERSGNIKGDISHDYNREGRIGMPIIAIFMLALACFNYINIAIVSAAKRLKEIGVRKVIGANRARVVVQFLSENIVVTFFALAVGSALGAFVFLPWFVQFTGWDLELHIVDKSLWIFLVSLLLFTGLVSGMYPAFYISRFEAVKIFKGNVRFGKKNPLTKSFLVVQLVLACITITAAVVFTQNNQYQYSLSWGYQQQGALFAAVPDKAAFDKLNAAMLQNANVIQTAGSGDHLGKSTSTAIVRTAADDHYEVSQLVVDSKYIETMRLVLKEGRSFIANSENDKHAIVVNELFVANTGLKNPVGAIFKIDSVNYEVIGVVKDFHAQDFFVEVQPTIFKTVSDQEYKYLSMRVKDGSEKQTYASLQKQWAVLFPETPFQGGYQADVWSDYFHSVDQSESFNKVIASIAVLLASLGLYGLVTLNVSGRFKEFSIRKTLGAGVKNITGIIMKQYMVLALIALIIGAPASYLFTKAYLDMLFAYPMPMGFSGIALSLFILVAVLVAVISTQIRRVVKSNPVLGLKEE